MIYSYSKINTYLQCPAKFDFIHHSMLVKDETSAYGDEGFEIHSELEQYCAAGKPLMKAAKCQPYADKIIAAKGQHFYEKKVAITKDFTPCEFFDNSNCFLRGVIDVLIRNNQKSTIIDWKWAKRKEDNDLQMLIFAVYEFINNPQCETITTSLIWLKEDLIDSATYVRSDLDKYKTKILKPIQTIELDLTTGAFVTRKSGLCSFCPAKKICPAFT